MSETIEIEEKIKGYMKYLEVDEIKGYEFSLWSAPSGSIAQVEYCDGEFYATKTKANWFSFNAIRVRINKGHKEYEELLNSVLIQCEDLAINKFDCEEETKRLEAEEEERIRIRNEKLATIVELSKIEADSS